jgi:hypothetical protein
MLTPIETVNINLDIKMPEDYFSISYGFPNKGFLLGKGLDTGITLVVIGHLTSKYAPKAIDRWKHNLRKQLGKELFRKAMYRTTLVYMSEDDALLYMMDLMQAETNWKFKTIKEE